jgi:predicted O-linked N-acetylglucosamine transferase (SPINDLY family)
MNDPWGSFQNFMNGFRQFASNPAQYMMQRYGISQDIANDPNAIIQKMMGDGRVTQEQYNSARQIASQIQNNPMFNQFMGKK